jgi:hypothetical protein
MARKEQPMNQTRSAGVIIAALGMALLVAACGGGSSTGQSASITSA